MCRRCWGEYTVTPSASWRSQRAIWCDRMTDHVSEIGVLALTLLGWAVVAYVVLVLPVDAVTQAVFYTAGFVALTGACALLLELYHARSRGRRPRPLAVQLLGTGMRFAFLVEFGLWLQSLRMLTAAYVVLLFAGFLFIEYLFQKPNASRGELGP